MPTFLIVPRAGASGLCEQLLLPLPTIVSVRIEIELLATKIGRGDTVCSSIFLLDHQPKLGEMVEILLQFQL